MRPDDAADHLARVDALLLSGVMVGAFLSALILLFTALANQASVGIENARLYAEAQYQIDVQTKLYKVMTLLRSSLDLTEILEAVAATTAAD